MQDIWNAFMVEGAKFSVKDIPMCPTTTSKTSSKLISFDDAKAIHKREMRRGNKDYKVVGDSNHLDSDAGSSHGMESEDDVDEHHLEKNDRIDSVSAARVVEVVADLIDEAPVDVSVELSEKVVLRNVVLKRSGKHCALSADSISCHSIISLSDYIILFIKYRYY
jgi:hypothetical protein